MGSTATPVASTWGLLLREPDDFGEGLVVQLGGGIGAVEIDVNDGAEDEVLEGGRGEPPGRPRLEDRAPLGEGLLGVEGLAGRMDVEGLALTTSCPPLTVASAAHEKDSSPKVMKKSPYSSLSSGS